MAYAGLVWLWSVGKGTFGDRLAGPLILLGVGVSIVTGLGAGLMSMKLVRLNSLEKWRAILAVLILSVVSAIAPPIIVALIPLCFGAGSGKEAMIVAAVPAFVTVLFGIVNFVSFSLGILCVRSKSEGGPESEASG
jgi:hypothetical protein